MPTVNLQDHKPQVRFNDKPAVVPTPRKGSRGSMHTSPPPPPPVLSVPPSPHRKEKPHRKLAKVDPPMYLSQTNHPVPRPLLRDSGIMGPGDNTINPLEPAIPPYMRSPPGQYGTSFGHVYGHPYLPYYPMSPMNSPSIHSVPSNVMKPGDNTINPLEPVIPPMPAGAGGTPAPMFGTPSGMYYFMSP